jgi:hypothetical protein
MQSFEIMVMLAIIATILCHYFFLPFFSHLKLFGSFCNFPLYGAILKSGFKKFNNIGRLISQCEIDRLRIDNYPYSTLYEFIDKLYL